MTRIDRLSSEPRIIFFKILCSAIVERAQPSPGHSPVMNVAPPRCSLDEVDDDWVESSVSARRRRAARLSDIEDGDNTSRVHRDAAPSACHLSWNRLCAFVKIPAATSAPAWRRALSSVASAGKQPQALPTPAQRQLLFNCGVWPNDDEFFGFSLGSCVAHPCRAFQPGVSSPVTWLRSWGQVEGALRLRWRVKRQI